MSECKPQRAITTHRKPGHPAVFTVTNYAVVGLDIRHKLRKKKVAVAVLPVGGVDEEVVPSFGSDHQKISNLALLPEILDQTPAAAAQKRLLVLAETMQKIQHRIFLAGFFLIAGGEHYAIAHGSVQDMAAEVAAIYTAFSKDKG